MQQRDEIELRNEALIVYFRSGHFILLEGTGTADFMPVRLNKKYSVNVHGVTVESPVRSRILLSGDYTFHKRMISTTLSSIACVMDEFRCRRKMESSTKPDNGAHPKTSVNGPRIMIVGDTNTGKTFTGCCLANAATRTGEFSVAFVDLDVGQQQLSIAGAVSCGVVQEPRLACQQFDETAPISFYLGNNCVTGKTRGRYLDLCQYCASVCVDNAKTNKKLDDGGLIINTMGWTRSLGLDLLRQQMDIFQVTHVVFTAFDPDLEDELVKSSIGHHLELLLTDPIPFVVKKGGHSSKKFRNSQMMKYFFGSVDLPLACERNVCAVSSVEFLHATNFTSVIATDILPNTVCAVLQMDNENVWASSVAGYIVVLEATKQFFSFLTPQPAELPSNKILVSSFVIPSHLIPPVQTALGVA